MKEVCLTAEFWLNIIPGKLFEYFPSGRYVLANHALRDKKVILFYFAARSAAQDFAPYLREAYEVRPEAGGNISKLE